MAASRRTFLTGLAALVGGLPAGASARAAEPAGAIGSGLPKSFTLQKQLETGLKARRPSDFAYIAGIVAKVDNGTLPRKLVDQAFLYARNRSMKYPLIYFQFTLAELSKKAGVTL